MKKNITYQTIYNLVLTILPLITAPYLARTLGVTSQGIYSYNNSIVNFFVLFAMLGITNHGTRVIAQNKKNKLLCDKKFSLVFTIQIISSAISFIIYLIYLIFFVKENNEIATIQILFIVACFFDINWLFMGVEDFKFVVTRNIIIRIIVVMLIILFVKKTEDLWIYTILMSSSTLISNGILFIKINKYVNYKIPKFRDLICEIKPILVLFIPLVALSIYHIMDKTMLGILSSYENVGYYYNVDKLINIPIGIITGISTVLFPRSIVVLEKSTEEFKNLLKKGLEGTIIVSIALSFGISAIAKEFVPIFFGNGFDPCIKLVYILSPVMVIKSISTIIRYQYLIPLNKEKYFIYSVLIGAVSNFILNLFLIPKYGATGAVLGTLIAETIACLSQILLIKKEIRIISYILNCTVYFIIGLLMLLIVRFIANNLDINIFIKIIIQILIGGLIYILTVFGYWIISKKYLAEINSIKKIIRER